MKIVLTICLAITTLFPSMSHAQVKSPKPNIDLQSADRLNEIMDIVDAHYGGLTEWSPQYESELLKWKRWDWYMSSHLSPEGDFVDIPKHLMKATKAASTMEMSEDRAIHSNWISEGPASSPLANPDAKFNGVGRVNRVAFHPANPGTIFIGAPYGGLWKSTNDGATWTNLTDHLPSISVSGIVISYANPDHIYILTGDGDGDRNGASRRFGLNFVSLGVFKSVDGGDTWQETGVMNNVGAGYQLVQDPNDPDVLIAAAAGGIYRTDDGGASWDRKLQGRTYDVCFKPGNSQRLYATQLGQFFYSTNNGNGWISNALFLPAIDTNGRMQIAVTQNDPSVVYVVSGPALDSAFAGLWKSTNEGLVFDRQSTSPNILGAEDDGSGTRHSSAYNLCMAAASNNANRVIVAALTAWRSVNSGVDWINSTSYDETDNFPYIHPDIHDLQYNALNHHLYAATDGGLYKSTDHGINWTDLSEGIETTMFYHLRTWNGSSPKMLAGCHDNGIKYRRGSDKVWHHVTQADGFDIAFNPLNGEPGYGSSNSGITRYSNDGNSASSVTPPGDTVWFKTLAVHNTRPDTVILGSWDIRYSHDGGSNWTTAGQSGSWAVTSCPSNNSKFYAAGGDDSSAGDETNSGAYRSTDIGVTWTEISGNDGFPPTWTKITDIVPNPINSQTVYITFGGIGNASEKVFRSINSGNTWTNITDNLPDVAVWTIGVDDDNSLYVGTDIGVFYRSAGMAQWMWWSNGLPNCPVTDISVQDSYVRCSTFGRGAWKSLKANGCTPALVLANPLQGIRHYEVDDFITATADITSGAGTFVSMRAGNHIDLRTGFEAANGSRVLARIGPCGQGGIPSIWQPSSNQGSSSRSAEYGHERDIKHAFPLGTIDHVQRSGSMATIDFTVRSSGNVTLALERDGIRVKTLSQSQKSNGLTSVEIQSAGVAPGFYYLVLYNNDRVAHFQEFVIE